MEICFQSSQSDSSSQHDDLIIQTKPYVFQDDSNFRDKITPLSVFLDYRIDYDSAEDSTGLIPVLTQLSPTNASRQVWLYVHALTLQRLVIKNTSLKQSCQVWWLTYMFLLRLWRVSFCACQAHILLNCGDDNICKPDLRLTVKR